MDMKTVARDSFQVVVYRVAAVTSFSFFFYIKFFRLQHRLRKTMRKLGRYLINSKILACSPLYPPKPSRTMR